MEIRTTELAGDGDIRATALEIRRQGRSLDDVTSQVASILDEVRTGGDDALLELTRALDGVSVAPGAIEVDSSAMDSALGSIERSVRGAMEKACARIERFAEASMPADWSSQPEEGLSVGQVHRPLDPVGIYVPGGRYPYPSTVFMTAIPARVAGVRQIVLCTPPSNDGSVDVSILAAAAMVGGCRVFRAGGAQAVAAMAFGTRTIPRCRMIAGPGNVYVAAAKRLVADQVKVDLEAGPSEIVVICDRPAAASVAACDLVAQLEHDPMAMAVLLTDSPDAVREAQRALELEGVGVGGTAHLVLCEEIDGCVELAEELAPEHLELMIDAAEDLLPRIGSAGCVFMGEESAVAFGDYLAGPSHVLPTGGAARYLSGLQPVDFTRTMNVVRYGRSAYNMDKEDAIALALLEGLERHARSIRARDESSDEGPEV